MTAAKIDRRQVNKIRTELRGWGSKHKAAVLAGFFKTGPGEYAEGDRFIGVQVPRIRSIAKKHVSLSLEELSDLIASPIHEERLLALLVLIARFEKTGESERNKIVRFYLKNTRYINNWDLVDLSAHQILGAFLRGRNKKILYRLARSVNFWERRIAIVATFEFIKHFEFADTFKIAGILLKDKEDLIHKAVGWMLREAGKRDQQKEEKFLKKSALAMPRTALRYAIERFSQKERRYYLSLPRKSRCVK